MTATTRLPPRSSWARSTLIVILAILPILSDIAVLFSTFHKFKFGSRFTGENWPIHDGSVIQIISIAASLLRVIVAYVGAVTVSQIWAYQISMEGRVGRIVELQSLGIFQSVSTIFDASTHLLRGHFGRRSMVWLLVVVSAIHVLLYPSAIITLGTPTITTLTGKTTNYQYTSLPFMSYPGYGDRCNGSTTPSSCVSNLLAGSAMIDIGAYNASLKPLSLSNETTLDSSLSVALRTTYTTPATTIQVWMNLGPRNSADMTSGAILFAQNFGTLERLLQDAALVPAPSHSIFDASAFTIDVSTTVPVMTSQCALIEQDNSSSITDVTIGDTTYTVHTPIPLVADASVIAQVTTDGMTLVISFKPDGSGSNIHCAINIGLRSGQIFISKAPSIISYPYDSVGGITSLENPQSIAEFATAWLGGIGWKDSPVRDALSEILTSSNLSVGADSSSVLDTTDKKFAEYYTLAMLSGAINIAFPPEQFDPTSPAGSSSKRYYQVTKTQFYLGLITPARIFWIAILAFNIFFMFTCIVILCTITPWYPDWSDPITLLRTTARTLGAPQSYSLDEDHPEPTKEFSV